MTVLTPAQIDATTRLLEHPVTGFVPIGRRMLARRYDPTLIAGILEVLVAHDGPAVRVLLVGQECPACGALHDETAWARVGASDGYCSQACEDDDAQDAFESRQAWGRSEFAWPERAA